MGCNRASWRNKDLLSWHFIRCQFYIKLLGIILKTPQWEITTQLSEQRLFNRMHHGCSRKFLGFCSSTAGDYICLGYDAGQQLVPSVRRDHSALIFKRQHILQPSPRLSLLGPQDGSTLIVQNVRDHSSTSTSSYPRCWQDNWHYCHYPICHLS